jgi:predicted RNA-binding protein YlqC (UPF0109 family)
MKDLADFILKSIVNHPDDVVVKEEEKDNEIFIEISVNSEDMGKVIGKQGKIIKSIRSLLFAKSIKAGKKVNVNLLDPETKPEA